MKTAQITALAGKIADLYKKDRDHYVLLRKDYIVGEFAERVLGRAVPDYECGTFAIIDRVMTAFATTPETLVIDGASLSPDKCIIDIACGYVPHDLGYAEAANMARDPRWIEAGWNEADILRLFDIVFANCLKAEADREDGARRVAGNLIARLYYTGVRLFGRLYHRIFAALAVSLAFSALVGCSGCAIPDGFAPSDERPQYESVPVGDAAEFIAEVHDVRDAAE